MDLLSSTVHANTVEGLDLCVFLCSLDFFQSSAKDLHLLFVVKIKKT